MSAPTPAAVRAAMKLSWEACTSEEQNAWKAYPIGDDGILRNHIRAVAQEMRAKADIHEGYDEIQQADTLREFANKLEGMKK